jgi:peptidase E
MKLKKKIIAIGGVGVTPDSDKNLDLFILNQLKKTKNNIGFLATASEDNDEKIEKFYKKFENNNSDLISF